ncbi:hypothetical protein SISNIDRAFT_485325 [Sistotremastrum niveocremeum HHB9708]|uniref:MSP domain-containing protein n=1 Tax=Sistotremastrum niveocremeum HHB9708 TaxID=1314777 RepID=A0A164V0T4_9AGAM|nr:hypothetical protein SISNIDRAFT_485325 [Sistotremastrum niveocremeum HHB9708]
MGDLSIFPEDYFYFNGPFSGPATLRLTNDGSEPLAIKVQTLRVALKMFIVQPVLARIEPKESLSIKVHLSGRQDDGQMDHDRRDSFRIQYLPITGDRSMLSLRDIWHLHASATRHKSLYSIYTRASPMNYGAMNGGQERSDLGSPTGLIQAFRPRASETPSTFSSTPSFDPDYMYNLSDQPAAPPYNEGSDGGYSEPPSALLPHMVDNVHTRILSQAAMIIEQPLPHPAAAPAPLSPVEEVPSAPSSVADLTPSAPTPAPKLVNAEELNAAYETLMDKYEAAREAMEKFAEALDAIPVDPEIVRRRRRRALAPQSTVPAALTPDASTLVGAEHVSEPNTKGQETTSVVSVVKNSVPGLTKDAQTTKITKIPFPHVLALLLFVFTVTYKFL